MIDAQEFDYLMKSIFKMHSKPNPRDTVIRFEKDFEMLWKGQYLPYHYFGEWSEELNSPHGRGVWFGGNSVRVGYYTRGSPFEGKVYIVVNNITSVGTETFSNGNTYF